MKNDIGKGLTLVIVSFNSGEVILKTLGDLLKSSICKAIIVDNASTDNSVSLLRESFPDVNLIKLSTNIGYGSAANVAFREVGTEYGLLLNPDILLSGDSLKIIFNKVVSSDKKNAIFSPALKKQDHFQRGDIIVDYLIGAFLLFRMESMRDVGFFDENIFLFYEEKDIELRLINKGYQLLLLSDIYVEHLVSASTKSNDKIIFLRNWHVAWSSLHYFYKHKFMTGRYQGVFLMLKYATKYFININKAKRLKYKARFLGARAYLKGEGAFTTANKGRYAP